jgi:excinuclease ABC subunit C
VFDHKSFLSNLTAKPGVYRMLDEQGDILYVGKASNLRNRVSSYFRTSGLAAKTVALVSRISAVDIIITESETEALLLEQNLIKSESPPFNILLRDDKSYPYILLSRHKDYPSLTFTRARKRGVDGTYFGPFPSSGSVRESLALLQKLFKIRQCEESFYRNRQRPCLQHQINRCSAPCVGLISEEDYQREMKHAVMFLQGRNPELLRQLLDAMNEASEKLEFEKAANLRDQISYLRHVQEQQAIDGASADVDVIAVAQSASVFSVQVVFVRGGRMLGNKSYFPKNMLEDDIAKIIEAFIGQFYLGGSQLRDFPKEIVLSQTIDNIGTMTDALKQIAGKDITIKTSVRGDRAQWLNLAKTNAKHALESHLSTKENLFKRYSILTDRLNLASLPKRMECFDISHSHGESTVASCVVFNEQGAFKQDYRQYNITDITAGDDYAAMRQALLKRYSKHSQDANKLPDIVLIDGGKGQLNIAAHVFAELKIDTVLILGVGKGVTRKAGMETILRADNGEEIVFPATCPGLHLIQQIRDEAHRFAITGHRSRRDKKRKQSTLEQMSGVGPKRRKSLIQYFGGLQEIKKASPSEIAKVPGISASLAQKIYEELHAN